MLIAALTLSIERSLYDSRKGTGATFTTENGICDVQNHLRKNLANVNVRTPEVFIIIASQLII
jgi:hypothetical protein